MTTSSKKKRDSIRYGSPNGGEWLKTRDVRKALDKVTRFLTRLTTFEQWADAELDCQLDTTEALSLAYDAHVPQHDIIERARTHDRAAFAARGIALDERASEMLDRFGPARIWRWSSGSRWRSHAFQLEWKRESCATPTDWLDYVVEHQAEKSAYRPRVELRLFSGFLTWIAPATRAPLPLQDPAHYPPFAGTPSGCRVSCHAILPGNTLLLDGRLPFESVDDAFLAYDRAITDALGHALSPKNFRAYLSNADGTNAYERKLPPWR